MVGIYANVRKASAEILADRLADLLLERNVRAVKLERNFTENPDLIVVIGGDGTVLDVALRAARTDTPVLSVNAGDVGFLSCFEKDEIVRCADFIKNGVFETEERPLLCFEDNGKTYYALNEILVQRIDSEEGLGCTLSLSLSIDGVYAEGFRADGLIIATPTGSTAYSLSAGGAVMVPSLKAFIATPVCAHTLSCKPIVFSDEAVATVSLSGDVSGGVFCDGKFCAELPYGNSVSVKKSDLRVKFIKGERSFYETLFRKLSSWGIGKEK
ncbi:MAG: NAD(+)/NADH kinase [Clostridia bacterium]|nr:NAD(+)/NADH kinase [Clostridia bacterium]